MKPIEYFLEVYEPGSADDVWITFHTSSPFQAINVGDILNPGLWPNSQSPMKVLRVTCVEHLVWESPDAIKHKLCVYNSEMENDRASRHPESDLD